MVGQCTNIRCVTMLSAWCFLQTHNKANTPLEGVSNVDATVPVVRKVYVSSGCQVDIPAVSSEGIQLL